VIKPQNPTHDPFDLDYDADDEFAPAREDSAWGGDAPAQAAADSDDAFADIGLGVEPGAARDAEFGITRDFENLDPMADDRHQPDEAPVNPVHELMATAGAAFGEVAIPRIAVHIFAASDATVQIAETAAADRRMERAATVIRSGGLPAALETYQTQATPSLVIVESLAPGAELLAGLDRLAEVCDPGTKVVVIGAANDIALYRELMRRGVSEYLVPPLNALQMVRAIGSLYADPSAPFVGRQIAFCGAKGGSGVSTLAHNIAHSISERLASGAVLVDLDLPFGTAGLDFNQDPLQGVADALNQPDRLDPVLLERMMARCTDRLSLFAAPATLDHDYDINAEAFDEVTQKIRGTAPFVILDLPHVWTAWKRKILLTSDDLVIVATPDLASLRNAKNIVDLVRRARPNDAPPRLVLNQVGVPNRPEISAKDFGEALDLTPAAVLPFDAKLFGTAANNGQMVDEVGPKSKAAEAIAELARQITRRDPPVVQKTSFLASLLKRK